MRRPTKVTGNTRRLCNGGLDSRTTSLLADRRGARHIGTSPAPPTTLGAGTPREAWGAPGGLGKSVPQRRGKHRRRGIPPGRGKAQGRGILRVVATHPASTMRYLARVASNTRCHSNGGLDSRTPSTQAHRCSASRIGTTIDKAAQEGFGGSTCCRGTRPAGTVPEQALGLTQRSSRHRHCLARPGRSAPPAAGPRAPLGGNASRGREGGSNPGATRTALHRQSDVLCQHS